MAVRLREHAMWVPALVVLGLTWLVADDPAASLRWVEPTRRDARLGVVAFVVGLLLFQALTMFAARLRIGRADVRVLEHVAERGTVANIAVALTAGITEEVVFRGFALEHLGDALGSYRIAGVVTCVVFVAAHLAYWRSATALAIVGPSAALTWLFVATRNLPVCIVVHAANDLWAFVVAPRVLATRVRRPA
jgi:membrane protease YdiL (CAAX protease family)